MVTVVPSPTVDMISKSFISRPRARQAEAKTVAGRIAVAHGALDVGNTRSLVSRDHEDAASAAIVRDAQADLAMIGIDHDVARDL
jgi:hypothetical protein